MKQLPILLALPVLSACSLGVYGDDFECDPSKGMGCKSVSDVNETISEKKQSCLCSHQRIYFPAHEDERGNHYGESYVTLTKGGSAE